MKSDLNSTKGYYTIIQYIPDLERIEAVNIGVALFCPELPYFKARLSTNNKRVKSFFKIQGDHLEHFKAIKQAFKDRIEFEESRLQSWEDFQQFVNTRANNILLTSPRPIKVADPNTVITELFERLIGQEKSTKTKDSKLHQLHARFEKEIKEAGITDKIERNFRIELPTLGRNLEFPYKFQNGKPNVIRTEFFGDNVTRTINKACILGVEGRDLQQHLEFTVHILAQLDRNSAASVSWVLEDHGIKLWTADQIAVLVQEIKERSH